MVQGAPTSFADRFRGVRTRIRQDLAHHRRTKRRHDLRILPAYLVLLQVEPASSECAMRVEISAAKG
jgi:hypothetical protein